MVNIPLHTTHMYTVYVGIYSSRVDFKTMIFYSIFNKKKRNEANSHGCSSARLGGGVLCACVRAVSVWLRALKNCFIVP